MFMERVRSLEQSFKTQTTLSKDHTFQIFVSISLVQRPHRPASYFQRGEGEVVLVGWLSRGTRVARLLKFSVTYCEKIN